MSDETKIALIIPGKGTVPGNSDVPVRGNAPKTPELDVETVRRELTKLSSIVPDLSESKPGGLSLSTVTLRVEFSAEGKLGFIVAEGKASGTGAIELVFSR